MLPTATPNSSAGKSDPTKKQPSHTLPYFLSCPRYSSETARTIKPNSTSMTAR